jgi:hypothetical protein
MESSTYRAEVCGRKSDAARLPPTSALSKNPIVINSIRAEVLAEVLAEVSVVYVVKRRSAILRAASGGARIARRKNVTA